MSNPYQLYFIDSLKASKEQIKKSKGVQRKVSRMINLIVARQLIPGLTRQYIRDMKDIFDGLDSSTGVQDTCSREVIADILKKKLMKKAGCTEREADKWVQIWWNY